MAEKVTKMSLSVDLQCSRCYKKIKKLLCKFPEIQDQRYDEKSNKVIITVVCCSPDKIRQKLCCKGGGLIKSIDIIPKKEPGKKEPEKEKEPEKKEPEKEKEPEKKEPEKNKEPEKKEPEKKKEPVAPVLGYPPVYPFGVIGVSCRPWYEGYGRVPFYHGHGRPPPCFDGCDCGCGGIRRPPCYDGCGCGCGGTSRPRPCYDGCGCGCGGTTRRPPCYVGCECGCGGTTMRPPCYVGCGCGCGGTRRPPCYVGCGCGCGGTTIYVNRSDQYFCEENPSACTIM